MTDLMLKEILARLDAAFAKYGLQAAELVLMSIRITALRNFVAAVAGIVGTLILVTYMRRWWKVKYEYDDDTLRVVVTILGGLIGTIICLVSIATLLDPWLYVAYANPKLYLAKQLMDAVLAHK